MADTKYKGFTIKHGFIGWVVENEAGVVNVAPTKDKAKEWINKHPIEDFTAICLFGRELVNSFVDDGVKGACKHLQEYGGGTVIRRVFTSLEAKNAYFTGMEDMDGWGAMDIATEKEYKQLVKYI